jgi:site-specific recombinase XerD
VADLDFTQDVAHVIGKGRRPRALPFGQGALPLGQQTGLALGRYLRARAKERRAVRRELWLAEKNGVGRMLRPRGVAAGIPGRHAHLFGHTAAHECSPPTAARPTWCA